jgi:RHS repeat-associated protein
VTAQTLILPDKPASINGLADPASVKVFSGQVDYKIPITLPAGRAGFGPSLALNYSGDLGNGPLGVGWTLGTFAIKRSLRYGVPSYTDADELELIGIAGGGRLYTCDGKQYWVEGKGTSVKVERKGRWFEVTDANGVRYILGMREKTFQEVDGKRSAWFVDSIIDVTGLQRIEFTYEIDNNEVYLETVTWGPPLESGGDPAYLLEIIREERPDQVQSWARGFEVKTRQRIKQLKVKAFGEYLRQYDLAYEAPDKSFRLSRLNQVHVSGFSKSGGNWATSLALPDTTFDYVKPTLGKTIQVPNLEGWVLNDRGVNLLDVDGDGMADLYRMEMGRHVYRKGTGTGFSTAQYTVTGAESTDLESTRLMDLDGDARPDLVRIVNDTWRWSKLQPEKPGSLNFQWVTQGEWPGTATVPLNGPDVVFADINGDGRADVLQAAADALLIRFNSQNGLGPVTRKPLIDPYNVGVDPANSLVRFEDLNGDGLVDVIWLNNEWMKTWVGRGDGTFAPLDSYKYPWGTGAFSDKEIMFADLDRDGLLDLVRITIGYVTWFPGLPGGGFDTEFRMAMRPTDSAVDAIVSIADANGNGSRDIVWSAPTGMWLLDLAGDGTAGMVESIDNGMGLLTKVKYSSSALLSVHDEAAGKTWENKLPVSVPVPVTTVTSFGDNGVTPDREVTFGIRNGVWDGQERRFAGFLVGARTVSAGTAKDLLHEEMGFLAGFGTDRVLRGIQNFTSTENGLGQKYSEASSVWVTLPVALLQCGANPLSKKPAKLSETTKSFEGVTTPIVTSATFEYDGEVRLVREHHLGRVDMSGDEKEIVRTYSSNATFWVRDRVCDESLYEADGTTLVSQAFTTYGDSTSLATAEDGEPCGVGFGWVRRTTALLKEENRQVTQSERDYDQYGNPVRVYERGVSRAISYTPETANAYPDSLFATQESITPSTGNVLAWKATWDRRLGKMTGVIDANSVTSTVAYDALGRQISVATNSPDPHLRYVYDLTAPYPTVTTYIYDGELGTSGQNKDPTLDWGEAVGWRQTTLVSNGAGEDRFSATRLASTRWIISGWKERDSRGKVVRHGDPFYWDGTTPRSATAPTDPDLFHAQTLKYDALGRLIEQNLPNGGNKTVTYKAFEQTVTASELAPVRSVQDGQGRIIHTERTVAGILEQVDALYNAAGQITSMSLQGGKAVNPEPGTAVHQFRYDSLGRLVWAHDPDIKTREMRYSDEGFLVRHKNGAGDVLAFFYDHAGRLTGRGARPASAFNDPIDPFAPPTTGDFIYHYDVGATEVQACSDYIVGTSPVLASSEMGVRGRLAWVEEPPSAELPTASRVAFCYDPMGRQRVMYRTIGGTVGWQFDRLAASGLPLQSRNDDGFKLRSKYDPAGRTLSLIDVSASDSGSKIWQAGQGAEPDGDTGLDAAGRVLGEAFGNGQLGTYTRDAIGLTSSIKIKKADQPAALYDVTIQRNKYGAPTLVSDALTTGRDQAAEYFYDGAARLTNATIGHNAATQWHFRYEYDGLQNMIGRAQLGPTASSDTGIFAGNYFYGERNQGPRQLSRITDKDCNGATTTFDYDLAGRMTQETSPKGTKVLTYDGYDQLVRVTISGATELKAAYGYDGLRTYSSGTEGAQYWFTAAYTLAPTQQRWHYVSVGDRLVARLTFANSSTALTRQVVLAGGVVREISLRLGQHAPQVFVLVLTAGMLVLLVMALRRRPSWQTAGAVLTSYALLAATSGCGSSGSEQRRNSLELTGTRIYFHQGVAAGPTLLTDHNGTTKDERRFEPFGQRIDGNLTKDVDPYNNLNKETNLDTGWSYHGARWMAPQTARWQTPDPPVKAPSAGFMAKPWTLNPYQYANQSPTLFWDPKGLCAATGTDRPCNDAEIRHQQETSFENQFRLGTEEGERKWGYDPLRARVYGYLKASGENTRFEDVNQFIAMNLIDKSKDPMAIKDTSLLGRVLGEIGVAFATAGALSARSVGRLSTPGAVKAGSEWKGPVLAGTTDREVTMYRIWGGEEPGASGLLGHWVTPVKPTSAAEARASLSLPPENQALFVSEVKVPAGTRFYAGEAAPKFGNSGGGVQVYLIDSPPVTSFRPGVPLEP